MPGTSFLKPKVVVSKCLDFDACRYDGQIIADQYIKEMKEFIDFVPVCPELEIGLGVPRDTIKIVKSKDERYLLQPKTGKDLTARMNSFSRKYLNKLGCVDGFILKSRSPSCGIKSVKVYSGIGGSSPLGVGDGFFAQQVKEIFPNHPAEDEKRLDNVFIREHFYTAVFTISGFREVDNMKKIYEYHAKHKYLFMSYNQSLTTKMGRVAANNSSDQFDQVRRRYYEYLLLMFKKRARHTSNINMLMHVMGYFKRDVSSKEKEHFLGLLEAYREKKVPLSGLTGILFSWATRFNNQYLLNQSLFNSFPMGLMGKAKSRFL